MLLLIHHNSPLYLWQHVHIDRPVRGIRVKCIAAIAKRAFETGVGKFAGSDRSKEF